MKKLQFAIDIRASRQTVWETMLAHDSYKVWTAEFSEGSYYEGSWEASDEPVSSAPTLNLENRAMKLYFDNPKRLKAFVQKHHTSHRYLFRGENRHGHGMFEPSLNGYPYTTANERASFGEEYHYFKKQGEKKTKAA